MGIYQSHFSIDDSNASNFDDTYVCKCDNEYVFKNMRIPEPQKYNIECYNPILDKIISKIGYYTKEGMKALNSYDYSKLKFNYVKKIPNNEDQLLSYSKEEFDHTLKDATEKIKYYKENIQKMKAIEEQRYDLHDAVYDMVEGVIPLIKALAHTIYHMKNIGLTQTMDDLNEVLKDEEHKTAIETMKASLKQGTYMVGLLKMMKMKHMSLDNTNPYYTERYIEYLMMNKEYYNGNPEQKMIETIQKYSKYMKNFKQFITQVESDYKNFVGLIEKFKLIDALFNKYNSIMEKENIPKEEKETLITIMRNFIEYYKKLSMIMKNSYYTYESAKDMIISNDDFVKLNQSNKRTLYLNEAFEDMGKNNKHDFINQIKLFIQTFNDYKNQLESGLPKVNGMLNYVENYDNLRLYVEEFIKYNQIEKHYAEYVKKYDELTEEYIDKKNKDPLFFENAINEIIHHKKIENANYEVNMEITKLDLIHLVLKLLNSNPPKKEDSNELQEVVKAKRGRKKKEDTSSSPIVEEDVKMNVKIMIFSDFSSIFKKITPLCDALNIKYVQLDGGNIRSIENAVKAYKFEDTQILFCDSTLFGCGMNFENTTHVIFTHTPNPEMQSQIIGRAQRIGRESILQVYQLHYPNEEMFNIIKKDTNAHMFHFMTAMKDGNQDNDDSNLNIEINEKEEGGETEINNL